MHRSAITTHFFKHKPNLTICVAMTVEGVRWIQFVNDGIRSMFYYIPILLIIMLSDSTVDFRRVQLSLITGFSVFFLGLYLLFFIYMYIFILYIYIYI